VSQRLRAGDRFTLVRTYTRERGLQSESHGHAT
jgi:hypothetical protein